MSKKEQEINAFSQRSMEVLIARKLLESKSIIISWQKPFIWASGWASPVYCNNRVLLSIPGARSFIKKELCSVIKNDFADVQMISGVATAGIAWGALVSFALKLPLILVRKRRKGDPGEQEEYKPGQKVIVIEDLISTGKSSIQHIASLRSAGLDVAGIVSIFDYGFDVAREAFSQTGITYKSLTNYTTLIHNATDIGLIPADKQEALLRWRGSPASWKGV